MKHTAGLRPARAGGLGRRLLAAGPGVLVALAAGHVALLVLAAGALVALAAVAAVIARAAFTSRGQAHERAIRTLDLIFRLVPGYRPPAGHTRAGRR